MLAHWRALTLTICSKHPKFVEQQNRVTTVVAHEIFSVLAEISPPPPYQQLNLRASAQDLVQKAADPSVEMRTQRAKYTVLLPLEAEYEPNGALARGEPFNPDFMEERTREAISDIQLEERRATLRFFLFPLVTRGGEGTNLLNNDVVIFPAQVVVSTCRQSEG